ncbi:MAG: right-handed parallel beta-helix repeat-containing protein [Actinomycetota bacterium]|nr:right-handed parallel beta-helix repeat-containing protein [Actinomycetota bacterium]
MHGGGRTGRWWTIAASGLVALFLAAPVQAAGPLDLLKGPGKPGPGAGPPPSERPPGDGSVRITGTTYYVSPSGSDANNGKNARKAWRTVARVNQAALRPGDGVLFEAEATFADAPLMPPLSGSPGAPIVYGAYGGGAAALPLGVWFRDLDDLAFRDLALQDVLQGHGHRVTVQRVSVIGADIGVYAEGDDWLVEGAHVQAIGDSGMIFIGARPTIRGSTIVDTGLDTSIPYGRHGIYLKASGGRVVGNTIRNFASNGVSVRDRDSVVEGNTISGGPIGIAWFQHDPLAGISRWTGNDISKTTAAGIYVSAEDVAGATRESFEIVKNKVKRESGRHLDLRPTTGTYRVEGNELR